MQIAVEIWPDVIIYSAQSLEDVARFSALTKQIREVTWLCPSFKLRFIKHLHRRPRSIHIPFAKLLELIATHCVDYEETIQLMMLHATRSPTQRQLQGFVQELQSLVCNSPAKCDFIISILVSISEFQPSQDDIETFIDSAFTQSLHAWLLSGNSQIDSHLDLTSPSIKIKLLLCAISNADISFARYLLLSHPIISKVSLSNHQSLFVAHVLNDAIERCDPTIGRLLLESDSAFMTDVAFRGINIAARIG
ncbi:hypothetical protein HDU76_011703, partial [Blyttiomyces sp. JEL0837]